MSKVAHYLQEHLVGEVTAGDDARRHFATDTSIFEVMPLAVVYPRNENDVRKATRFTWQLAERGKIIPITARGSGTDQTGAALGSGVIMVFPAHMNKILELDPKTGSVAVQPGLNFGNLQQTLLTHGRFLPAYPSSIDFSTIGGAIAKNAGGEKSVKYGQIRNYARSLRVVLANGEVIETRRISKRELSKKMGLSTMEGEIYRTIDALIEENKQLIQDSVKLVTRNSSGYALSEVKRKDGSFDLTPLIVGSEGTLAIVTEAVIDTEVHVPTTSLVVAEFDTVEAAADTVVKLKSLSSVPSAIELVDGNLLDFIDKTNPNHLKKVIEKPFSKVLLLIEFDDPNVRTQKKMVKKTKKIIEEHSGNYKDESSPEAQEDFWKIRHAASGVVSASEGDTRALPIIEDAIVPVDRLGEFMNKIYEIFEQYKLSVSVWGHAGDGNLHVLPLFNVGQLGDRQKIFKLMNEFYEFVISLGGSTSAQNGDGRLRGSYLTKEYGSEMYDLFEKTKLAFDPHGTLNPGVKTGVSLDEIKSILRKDYSLSNIYDYLPKS